ncbi:uncharacterized protein LOC143368588 isoform X2 [Andrena cerasifolii]|uniref:uncharacterized protein LOC143368588 isoform X2 n=1 Tax=Andrena cerasifolii TaxID=2819439 RepID=UPI0040377D57
MDPRGVFSVSIVCLLVAFAVASEAGSRAQETTLRAAPPAGYWGVRTTTASSHGDQVGRGHASRPQGERERVEPSGSGRQQEAEVEVDYEGVEEAEDEYEDELKAVAESHEAMSRDDTKNSDVSTAAGAGVLDEGPTAAKNFDSHEVITVNESDEDVASNEAITDEQVDKYDPEVAELLKYKKKRKSSSLEGSRAKTKRVPTVKKELSTQREILIGSNNETQVPKSLVPPEDTPNRLNEEPEAVRRRNVESTESIKSEDPPGYSERSSGEGEVPVDNRYSGSDPKSPKKLDKRQETDLARLKSLLAEYASEEEQRQKVRDSGTEKYAQGENVLKLLENLVEYVSRLERQQKLILYVQNKFAELKTGTIQEPTKTGYQSTSTPFPGTSGPPNDSRKSRKKLKKKKKKPRHRYPTTTHTPDPLPVFVSEGKPGLMENLDDFENQRLLRFGNVAARQPVSAQGHREFTSVYDRPADPERIAEYDVAEAYRNQLSPMSREFLRRQEDDYQGDFGMQGEGFGHGQGYEPGRDFSLSKSWPDISYKYSPPWKAEERPLVPIPSEKWPWRRPQNDVKYWQQRGKLLPVEKSYWSPISNEEDAGEEAGKLWQQQRAQHSWDRPRSSWPLEKPARQLPASWQQPERPVKLYDSEQANRSNVWEKSRFELNRPTKQEAKEKIILPQITMKTWNSLTSDPATWPHKLPGAKPWPKDENGKSYNPNADLVKKLGLDKQSNAAAKQEAEKSSAERKSKDDKQSRLFKESSKEEEFPQATSEYKPDGDRSDSSDYKGKNSESLKPWAMLAVSKAAKEWAKPENTQGDDGAAWRRKYEGKSSWSNDTALPEIQSVGAWVMSSDQSTWKPYQIKPIEPSDDSGSRRWPRPISKPSTDTKWSSKGSWAEKVSDAWMNHTNAGPWPEKPNVAEIWPGKASKPGSWFAKVKQTDGWTGKSSNPDSWKAKESEWMSNSENSWSAKGGSRSTKDNEPWTSKSNDEASKLNAEWPAKAKEEDSWKPAGDGWPRKSSDQPWSSKSNELSPWQQKMNEEWSYGKASSTGTWPSKWKQFAYHRVTALPISKPGTTADAGSSKSKNAFVAVSAVSSPKYTGTDWRKNEEEARSDSARSDDQERSTGQLQVGLERPIYAWKKDPDPRTPSAKGNASDPLENELEALRQINFWFYKENETEKRSATTNASAETTSAAPARSAPTTTAQRRPGNAAGSNGPLETNRRTISMK